MRGTHRKKVGEILCQKSVELFRSEEAKRLMSPEGREAPLFYKANVLYKAKHDKIASEYLNSDPIKALEILKTTALGRNVVHSIGQYPFYVIYFTSHQIQIYKQLLKQEHITLYIDASGVRVHKLSRPDGTSSHYIFLYHAVINSVAGQFSVSQFLSEIHTSTFIRLWLMEWCRLGAPRPKEVVTDASRALLTAVIKEFTSYPTIEQYADACHHTIPDCYIRIDVAHFVKTYSNALSKSTLRPVRTFYLAVIGQIVLCRQVEDARKILKALLVISQCELEGNLQGTCLKSDCEIHKQFLEQLITGKETFNEEELDDEKILDAEFDEDKEEKISSNWWLKWGEDINREIQSSILQKGTRANAHYAPHIATKLLRDIGTIPLWSNIYTDNFGYGRIPASSASVESEFNKLKNFVINKSLRVDKFVEEHIKYLIGRVIIADANVPLKSKGNISYL